MKKFLMLVALFFATICLSACSCDGSRVKYTAYNCTEFSITPYSYTSADGYFPGEINYLPNYKSLQIIFYNNGDFKWVGITAETKDENGNLVESVDEVYLGTYKIVKIDNSDEENSTNKYKITLYYDELNPVENEKIYGYAVYELVGDTLTRYQDQYETGSTTSHRLVKQTFVQVK